MLAQPEGLSWLIYTEKLHELGMTFEEYRNAHEAGAIKIADDVEQLAQQRNNFV